MLDQGLLRFRSIFMPDTFVDQASPNDMNATGGLNHNDIVETVFEALGKEAEASIRA